MRRWFVVSRDIVSFNALSRALNTSLTLIAKHDDEQNENNRQREEERNEKHTAQLSQNSLNCAPYRNEWCWHAQNGKATGWRDYEFVWHCHIPIGKRKYTTRRWVFVGLCRCWCWPLFFLVHFANFISLLSHRWAVWVQFSGSPFKYENEIKRNAMQRTEEGKKIRRHNLSFVWLVHMDEFSVCSSRISCCCALDLLHRTTQSHVEIRKCLIIGRSVHCAWHSGTQTPKPANAGPVKIDPKPKCKFGRSRWNEKWERETQHTNNQGKKKTARTTTTNHLFTTTANKFMN